MPSLFRLTKHGGGSGWRRRRRRRRRQLTVGRKLAIRAGTPPRREDNNPPWNSIAYIRRDESEEAELLAETSMTFQGWERGKKKKPQAHYGETPTLFTK